MSTDKIKTSRASQTREKTSRKTVWTPPSSLDAPLAPDGYHHRWIRAESMGFDDTKGSLELAAYCWLGYRQNLLNRAMSILIK